MTHVTETRLSLYAGGELNTSESSLVACHLEQCPECRKKADEFRLAAEWLKGVAVEPDQGQLYALREHVLRGAEPKTAWRAFGWITVAAVAVMLILLVLPRSEAPQKKFTTRVVLPPLPAGRAELGPLVLPNRKRHRAARHMQPQLTLVAKNDGNTPVIRVKTSDPNVVILWVIGSGSEQEKTQ